MVQTGSNINLKSYQKDAENYLGGGDASSQWGNRGALAARLSRTEQSVVLGGGDEGVAATPVRRGVATTFAPSVHFCGNSAGPQTNQKGLTGCVTGASCLWSQDESGNGPRVETLSLPGLKTQNDKVTMSE
jgi:hypothetical protein